MTAEKRIKYLKMGPYGKAASAIIVWSVVFRVILVALNYPEVNSDEGTMGIEAIHIAFQGQHPIYLYGQDYMGVLEAYIAAPFFHLFGVSAFTLRIGMILMFALFMVAIYQLATLLYSKKLALVALGLLSLATPDMLIQQLRAVGGAIETILFGAWMFVIAYLLAASAGRKSRKRYFLFVAWGFTAGIALWVHILVLPFVLSSGLLILVFCHREWRSWAIPCLLLGLLVGGFLLIPGYMAIPNALGIQGAGGILQNASPAELMNLPQKQLASTFLWGIPLATWIQPVCTSQDLPYLGSGSPSTLSCALIQGSWSAGYLLLLISGLSMACTACWKLRRQQHTRQHAVSEAEHKEEVAQFARLVLLFTGIMVIALYLLSPLSGLKPASTRYLVGLLVITPGILWPLWQLTSLEKHHISFKTTTKWLSRVALISVALVVLSGTVYTITTVPAAYANTRQQERLVQDLLKLNVRRVYLEYWACYRLLFQSQEQILCAKPPYPPIVGDDRYEPDTRVVWADPNAAYMFPAGNTQEITLFEQYMKTKGKRFQKFFVDGMVLYRVKQKSG
jgi:hypothetical protein